MAMVCVAKYTSKTKELKLFIIFEFFMPALSNGVNRSYLTILLYNKITTNKTVLPHYLPDDEGVRFYCEIDEEINLVKDSIKAYTKLSHFFVEAKGDKIIVHILDQEVNDELYFKVISF